MADRGFTIKDMLKELQVDLNILPFLEGRSQLSPEDVQAGRKIASLHIGKSYWEAEVFPHFKRYNTNLDDSDYQPYC